VPGLVEEGAPVVGAADRLDHEHHLVGHLDRRAEGPRRLLRALLDVEVHVGLAVEVDAEVGERRLQRRHHLLGRKALIPLRRADHPLEVPALGLVQRQAEQLAGSPVERFLVELLGRVEERLALAGEASQLEPEALVELHVVGRAELWQGSAHDLDGFVVDRVQVLLGRLPHRTVELLPPISVGLVRHRRAQHPERDRLAVDAYLELGLDLGLLLSELARQLPDVALAAEVPELAGPAVAVHVRAQRLHALELRQHRMALVDLLELEPVLQARVMEVVLLVELGEKAVGLNSIRVELDGRCRRLARHSP
jgi:hypothetical protein